MAKKVKLSKMTRGQLVKVAKKMGLSPKKTQTDDDIREMIEKARTKGEVSTTSSNVWPVEWPEDMRESYYLTIVRETMPKDPKKAYMRLAEVIETLTPHQAPRTLADGEPDCFALDYDPTGVNLDFCHRNCLEMPLCRAVCKERKGLNLPGVKQIEAMAEATEELAAMSAEDKAEIAAALAHADVVERVKPAAKKKSEPELVAKKGSKPVKKAGRADSNQVYVFVGKVKPYLDLEVLPEEYWDVYRWMKRRKMEGFTVGELADQIEPILEDRKQARESARDTIKYLLDEGDVAKQ